MSSSSDQVLHGRDRGRGAGQLARGAYYVGRGLGRLASVWRRLLEAPPWIVISCLVVANWLVIVEAARIAVHRGWLYYDGGDGTWYYTSAWVLAHGHVPQATIGYGYPLLIAPLTLIGGANLLAGLPFVIILNAVVLAPIAIVALYGLASAIGGRGFGYVVTAVWIALPLAAIGYFYETYHVRYVDVTLPAVVGLTGLGDFPSMVCLLVAAYFAYRAIVAPSSARFEALAAGLTAGIALGVKPANALFLPALACAFAIARRPRAILIAAVGIAPSLLALALWKYRGLGHIPVLSLPVSTIAGGVHPGGPVGSLPLHFERYLHFSYQTLKGNLDGFREWGWSKRLIEWATIAGLIGLARRTLAGAVLIGGWFAAYLLLKGGNPIVSFAAGNFFTHLIAAVPAWVLLVCSAVFCIPVIGRRPLRASTAGWPSTPRAKRRVVALLGFLAVIPIGVIVLLPPLTKPAAADLENTDVYIPANQFPVTTSVAGGTVTLHWPAQATRGAQTTAIVYRDASDGLGCTLLPHATATCLFQEDTVAEIPGRETSYRDHPPRGTWSYRVAIAANSYGPLDTANPLLLSNATTATVRT
jgi:hypothetical protein